MTNLIDGQKVPLYGDGLNVRDWVHVIDHCEAVLAVSPDGRQLWSTSKPNNHVYAWSLPDLEYLGGVPVGHHPDWLTMTPDSRYLYSANAGSNDVSVIDTRAMKEIARITVGQVPKRNHTAVIR